MSAPRFLAENFYSLAQFPGHQLVDGSAAAAIGEELFRVGTARRSLTNKHRNADPSLDLENTVECDRIRGADFLAIDRNSDIIGRTVTLRAFTDINPGNIQIEVIFSEVITDGVVLGSGLNDPVHQIRTNEGAWLWHFDETPGIAWDLTVEPLDGDSGSIGGLYLGKSFSPELGARMPFDDEDTWSEFGVVRRGVPDNDQRYGRTGAFGMMMNSESEWNEARRQLRELFGRGSPMWIAPDSDLAERTWLGYNAPGNVAAAFSERPQGRSVVIQADEYDPRLP